MPEPARPPKGQDVRDRARALITDSWQSQANLSLFLGLMVLIAFVLPSMGFGKGDIKLYSDVAFSLLLISGVAIAWGPARCPSPRAPAGGWPMRSATGRCPRPGPS